MEKNSPRPTLSVTSSNAFVAPKFRVTCSIWIAGAATLAMATALPSKEASIFHGKSSERRVARVFGCDGGILVLAGLFRTPNLRHEPHPSGGCTFRTQLALDLRPGSGWRGGPRHCY